MVDFEFEEPVAPRKKAKTPRPSKGVTTSEEWVDGRLLYVHSCGCGYSTSRHFNNVGASKTLAFHIKVSHI